MPLVWREQMSVGNTLIDNEHKYLLDQINAVESALHTKQNHDILVETLNHLVEYTQTHFNHEEQIQLKVNYPFLKNQQQEHQRIMTDLHDIKKKLDKVLGIVPSEGDTENHEEVTDSELNMLLEEEPEDTADEQDLAPLVALVRSWVVDHVIGSDMKMKPYLSKLPADFS